MLCLIVTFTPPVFAAPNLGSASTWAREGIAAAVARGFVPADIQGNYTNVITRAEFCRMAVMWVEYATGKSIDAVLSERGVVRDPNAFADTNDPYILAAFALGITSGTGDGRFTPNGQFSREQAATMIMNTCRAIGVDVSNPPAPGFADMGRAARWAVDGINFVRANGIMQGTGNNYFSPGAPFTREQSIVTFNNIDFDSMLTSNPPIDVGIVGLWVLDRMNISGIIVSDEGLSDLFPAGTPYFIFYENNIVEIRNFFANHNYDGKIVGSVHISTYTLDGNSVSFVDDEGKLLIMVRGGGDIMTMQIDSINMQFVIS